MRIHEAAKLILKELNRPATFKEIWQKIKEKNLFKYAEGVDEANITRNSIEKKCVNSTRTGFPKQEILFYRDEDGKYDLFEKLSEEEKRDYILEKSDELSTIKEQINSLALELEKLHTTNYNYDTFEKKYQEFNQEYKLIQKENENIQELIDSFNDEKEKVNSLIDNIKDTKQQLNFEKLDNGFIELLNKKEENKKDILKILKSFGISIFIIPIISIFIMMLSSGFSYIFTIPLLTIEIFLVYYFRIVLHNYNSMEEQILQLENKSAILKFITNYVEFKKDNNVKQEDISKFEEIIFSKISPNMKTIPTSPDVVSIVEKIAKIIKK